MKKEQENPAVRRVPTERGRWEKVLHIQNAPALKRMIPTSNPRTLLPPRGPVPQRTNFPPPIQISPTEAYCLPTYPPTHLPTYLVQPRFLSTRIIRIRVEKDTEERGRRRRRRRMKKKKSNLRLENVIYPFWHQKKASAARTCFNGLTLARQTA